MRVISSKIVKGKKMFLIEEPTNTIIKAQDGKPKGRGNPYAIPIQQSTDTRFNKVIPEQVFATKQSKEQELFKQQQIEQQNQKISKTVPEKTLSKAWNIATHPGSALKELGTTGTISDNLDKSPTFSPADLILNSVNPLSYVDLTAKAIKNTAKNAVNPKTYKDVAKTLGYLAQKVSGEQVSDDLKQGAINTGLVALDASVAIPTLNQAAGLAKPTLRKSVDVFHPIGKELKKLEKYAKLNNLTEHELKNLQMQKVGITSKQREGYFPGASEILTEYFTPLGYENMGKRILNIPKRIVKGQTNTKNLAKDDIEVLLTATSEAPKLSKSRYDAWKMYSGMPQKYGTFRLAESAPINHSSYTSEQLKNLEILSLNNEKKLLQELDQPHDFMRYHYDDEGLINNLERLTTIKKELDGLNNTTKFVPSDYTTTNVMGGHNQRFYGNKLEYNDIWDLNPGFKVEKYFGKPFMSHGQVDYNISETSKELKELIKKGIKLNEYPNIKIKSQYQKEIDDVFKNINNNSTKLKYLQKSNHYKKELGGKIIEDNRGQWAHPGEVTKINSSNITMKGVPYSVLGISDTGDTQLMQPNGEYKFNGNSVIEYPIKAQKGYNVPIQGINSSDNTRTKLTPKTELTKKEITQLKNSPTALKNIKEKEEKEKAQRIALSKQAFEKRNKLNKQFTTVEDLADETGAIGDKMSLQNLPYVGKYVPNLLDATGIIGNMASGLGRIPLNLKNKQYGQAALSIATPLTVGALGSLGAKNTPQFINNVINPLAGIKLKANLPEGTVQNGFSLSKLNERINLEPNELMGTNAYKIKLKDKWIGDFQLEKSLKDEGKIAIGNVYIKEPYRGKGFGKQVFTEGNKLLNDTEQGVLHSSGFFEGNDAKHVWNSLVKEGKAEQIGKDAWRFIEKSPSSKNFKSAVGNNGMFDMTNPNIYKTLVGGLATGTLGKKAMENKEFGGKILNTKIENGKKYYLINE